ncbi:hypothetical protein EVA_01807 [gut metagenome]|uniref:DNA mimic protein DMP19 C-terminal domain-containing protein n=1 Tax=gut metagenome TaxID=749906 RepID=J9H2K0_9ZZZZ
MELKYQVEITDAALQQAAADGFDRFIGVIVEAISQKVGGELNAESMQQLSADQITLWGYVILRDELMDGGFVQLIHNGYGPFFFDNPFAKAMRLWGLREFSKLLYKAKELYDANKDALTKECTDEEFMALFEQYPQFDDLDDEFVENENSIPLA